MTNLLTYGHTSLNFPLRCLDCCLKTKLIVCCVIWGFEGGLPGRKKSQNLAVAARPDAGGALPNWDNRRRAHKMRGVMLFGCCFCIGGGGGGVCVS